MTLGTRRTKINVLLHTVIKNFSGSRSEPSGGDWKEEDQKIFITAFFVENVFSNQELTGRDRPLAPLCIR